MEIKFNTLKYKCYKRHSTRFLNEQDFEVRTAKLAQSKTARVPKTQKKTIM